MSLEQISKLFYEKNEFGLRDLDNTQIEIIQKLVFPEEDIKEFKTLIGKLEWTKMHQFVNACFFLHESENICSKYCESIKYVLLFTAIESIMGDKDYMDFKDWLISNNCKGKLERDSKIANSNALNFKKLIEELFKIYIDSYGVTEHVRRFFLNYISLEDKKTIIYSIQKVKSNTPEISNIITPVPLMSDDEVNSKLKSKISLLYDLFRNKIVHQGARWILEENKQKGGICAGNSLLIILDETNSVKIDDKLNINKFRDIVTKGLKEYYKRDIKK
ncbi:MAG: hypothetical protein AABX11_04805 [Nanoarchaeota archaeon]